MYPEDLTFGFELSKQINCYLKLVNNTEHHVAFKMKTTSPKKYIVRPNTGVVQPWDSSTITVTLQAQCEMPPDMHCKDKFLLQSTIVPPMFDVDEIASDTFTKDGDKEIEERKLKVIYTEPGQQGVTVKRSSRRSSDHLAMLSNSTIEEVQKIQCLKEEKDAILQRNIQLQRDIEMTKKRMNHKSDTGFSLVFAALVGAISLSLGFIIKLVLS